MSEGPGKQDDSLTCSGDQSPPRRPPLLWRGRCLDVCSPKQSLSQKLCCFCLSQKLFRFCSPLPHPQQSASLSQRDPGHLNFIFLLIHFTSCSLPPPGYPSYIPSTFLLLFSPEHVRATCVLPPVPPTLACQVSVMLELPLPLRPHKAAQLKAAQLEHIPRTDNSFWGHTLLEFSRTHMKTKLHICYISAGNIRSSPLYSLLVGSDTERPKA